MVLSVVGAEAEGEAGEEGEEGEEEDLRAELGREDKELRSLQGRLEHRRERLEAYHPCDTLAHSWDERNFLRWPSVLPGACILHLPKCKTVVLDYEVLGGRDGMERRCFLMLLNSGSCSSGTSYI